MKAVATVSSVVTLVFLTLSCATRPVPGVLHFGFEDSREPAWQSGAGGATGGRLSLAVVRRDDPQGGACLAVSGTSLWVTCEVSLPEPLSLPPRFLVLADTRSTGRAWQLGLSVRRGDQWVPLRKRSVTVSSNPSHPYWRTDAWLGQDLGASEGQATISGIRFAQRQTGPVVQKGEPQPSGLAPQSLCIDNVRILTDAREIAAALEGLSGPRWYDGPLAARLWERDGLTLWQAPSVAKVFREQPAPRRRSDHVSMALAQGEGESFQLAFRSNRPLAGLSVRVSELRSTAGAVIPATAWDWHPVVPVPVDTRYFTMPVAETQWWPEALSWNRSFSLERDQTQSLWLTLRVPRDAAPGDYISTAEVRRDGAVLVAVPVRVRVWGFALPATSAFQTNQQLWLRTMVMTASGPPRPRDEVLQEGLELLRRNRQFDANQLPRLAEEQQRRALSDWGQNAVKLPYCGGHLWGEHRQAERLGNAEILTPAYAAAFAVFLREQQSHWRRMDAEDRAFVYLWDEPEGRSEELRMIAWLGHIVKRTVPGMPTLVAAAYDETLRETVDIFLQDYSHPEVVKEAQARGTRFWWWGNAAFMPDMAGVDQRLRYGLESFQKGIVGAYSWGIGCYRAEGSGATTDAEILQATWEKPERWSKNCVVLYPGGVPQSEPLRLTPSMSLELSRDGIEDYDYVMMLAAHAERMRTTGDTGQATAIETLLQRAKGFYREPHGQRTDFSAVDDLLALRAEMGDRLEALAPGGPVGPGGRSQ